MGREGARDLHVDHSIPAFGTFPVKVMLISGPFIILHDLISKFAEQFPDFPVYLPDEKHFIHRVIAFDPFGRITDTPGYALLRWQVRFCKNQPDR